MSGDDVFRQFQQHAPLEGVTRVHTLAGSLEDSLREISIEVREWEEDGRKRYHIRATNEFGAKAFGTNPYDSLDLAIQLFPWHELAVEGE